MVHDTRKHLSLCPDLTDLDAMNKRILTSCFIDSPDLPESCIDSSPLLALAIYLQTIVEAKEDSRVAISIMLTTANVHVVDAIDKAKKISEMDLVTAGPSAEDVWAGINKKPGPSGIARDMEGYVIDVHSHPHSSSTALTHATAKRGGEINLTFSSLGNWAILVYLLSAIQQPAAIHVEH